jgi:hypothetical protein
MPQSALHQYKPPLIGGEKHISGMEVFRQHQFHKVFCSPLQGLNRERFSAP